jgi:hypothetical protein
LKLRFAPQEIPAQTSLIEVGGYTTSDASDASGRIKVTTFPPGKYGIYVDDWNYEWATSYTLETSPTVQAPQPPGKAYKFALKKRNPKP